MKTLQITVTTESLKTNSEILGCLITEILNTSKADRNKQALHIQTPKLYAVIEEV